MSDWLNEDDGGYLGLDDPPMPDGALAPPSAPAPAQGGDGGWMDQGSNDDGGWITGSAGQSQGMGVADTQGDWLASDEPQAWTAQPEAPAHDPYAAAPQANPVQQQQYAPAPQQQYQQQPPQGGLSVGAPMLEHVAPSPRSIGGTRGELSNLVLDVEVQVEVGLGNSVLTVEEFLEMGRGSVVELDTPVDAPIELKVRGKLVARGQLVSINGSYGMRILEMLGEEH